MPLDIITIGSAVVDIFIKSKDFSIEDTSEGLFLCQRYGDKIELDRFEVHSGGGASNTGVAFAKLGFSVAAVCELGRDMWSDFVVNDLLKNKVDISLLIKEKKEQTGGSIILTGDDGGRTVMVHRGAASMLDPEDIPADKIKQVKWVHLTNIGAKKNTLNKIFSLIHKDTKLSWNPGKRELQLLAKGELNIEEIPVEILIVNDQEWEILALIQGQVKQIVPIILITKGKAGGVVYNKSEKLEYSIKEKTTVEETGAGDAFGSGFIASYILGNDLDTCLEWGKKNSASVVQHLGAKNGLLSRKEIEG